MNPDSSDLRYIMEKILILDFGSQYTPVSYTHLTLPTIA